MYPGYMIYLFDQCLFVWAVVGMGGINVSLVSDIRCIWIYKIYLVHIRSIQDIFICLICLFVCFCDSPISRKWANIVNYFRYGHEANFLANVFKLGKLKRGKNIENWPTLIIFGEEMQKKKIQYPEKAAPRSAQEYL